MSQSGVFEDVTCHGRTGVLTDLPHKEFKLPVSASRVRVSVPGQRRQALYQTKVDSCNTATHSHMIDIHVLISVQAVCLKHAGAERGDSMSLSAHLATKRHLHTEFAKVSHNLRCFFVCLTSYTTGCACAASRPSRRTHGPQSSLQASGVVYHDCRTTVIVHASH